MRDNSIQVLRIIFTVLIVYLHIGIGMGSYIAVEFFFVLSGFLLAYKVYGSGKDTSALRYIINRTLRLYPMYIISMLIYLFCVEYVASPKGFMLTSLKALPAFYKQLLMIFPFGSEPVYYLNLPCWYVAVLYFVSIVMYILLKYIDRKYITIILFILALVIMGIYFTFVGNLDLSNTYRGVTINGHYISICCDGVFRGIMDMSLGIVLYSVFESTHAALTPRGLRVAHVLEVIVFAGVIVLSYIFNHTRADYIYLVLILVGIYLAFLPHNERVFGSGLINYLGGLSYGIYLNHAVIAWVILRDAINSGTAGPVMYILCVCVLAIALDGIIRLAGLMLRRGTKHSGDSRRTI